MEAAYNPKTARDQWIALRAEIRAYSILLPVAGLGIVGVVLASYLAFTTMERVMPVLALVPVGCAAAFLAKTMIDALIGFPSDVSVDNHEVALHFRGRKRPTVVDLRAVSRAVVSRGQRGRLWSHPITVVGFYNGRRRIRLLPVSLGELTYERVETALRRAGVAIEEG